MNFDFNSEQQQLADAVTRWAEKDYGFEQRKHIIASDAGVSDQAWQALAELGVLALPVPSEHDGFDGNAVDQLAVMQALGRALMIEPVWASAMSVQCLKLVGTQGELLAQVAAGQLRLACAFGEPQARYELFNIQTQALREGDDYLLSGVKSGVIHGAQADQLIISARTSGAGRDTAGLSLFLVPKASAGLVCRDARSNDGMRVATLHLEQVRVPASARLGTEGSAWPLIEATADYAIALLCAEALGVMEVLCEASLAYLKTRQQFGVPIGKFQALQHRMAEMFIQLEQARSMAMLVAVKVETPDPEERRRISSAAKARIGEAMKFIGQQAVQLHGGMGVTNELLAAHCFKRLTTLELTLGDTDHHLSRFAAQPGFASAL